MTESVVEQVLTVTPQEFGAQAIEIRIPRTHIDPSPAAHHFAKPGELVHALFFLAAGAVHVDEDCRVFRERLDLRRLEQKTCFWS